MRYLLIILLAFALPIFPAHSADRVPGPISAEVLRVVDGDTVAVRALIWPGQRVEVKVRLARINAPELFRPSCDQEKAKARQATDFVQARLGTHIQLTDIRFGKYAGRVVADIQTEPGVDLGASLLEAGLAHLQKDKSGWCELAS
jgi:endonuclease YncB( thermonuclease family)